MSDDFSYTLPSGMPGMLKFPYLPASNLVFHEVPLPSIPLCNYPRYCLSKECPYLDSCLPQSNSALLDIHWPPGKMLFYYHFEDYQFYNESSWQRGPFTSHHEVYEYIPLLI